MRIIAILLLAASAQAAVKFLSEPALSANPNPNAPLAAIVRFKTDQPSETVLTVSDGRNTWELRYGRDRRPEDGLPVVGMRPGRKHTVQVAVRDARGQATKAAKRLEITTPRLPEAFGDFPPLQVRAPVQAKMEPGVTVISVRRQAPPAAPAEFSTRFGMLVAIDAEGEVVWYYRSGSRISDFERLRNGNILICTLDYEILEIDLLGNTIRRWFASRRPAGPGPGIPVDALTFHHEIDEMPNGNLVALSTTIREIPNYYTSETDPNAPRQTQKVMGDEIVEFTRDGKVVWRWDAFEHLDPKRIGYETFSGYWERRGFPGVIDWSHANNLLHDERDDSLLVSFRYQSAIIKVDRKTGRVRWILGKPDGWDGRFKSLLFTLAGGSRWFHHQHAPFPTSRGTLLVFDNGNYQSSPFDPPLPPAKTYSRAVEYRIDEKKRTAKEVWVSETGPGADTVISIAMGNAEELPLTGNVLVSYGALFDRDRIPAQWGAGGGNYWTRVREYTRTQPAQLVWEAVIQNDKDGPLGWQSFCSARWRSLAP
jgi:hypothetical protein